MTEQIQKLGQSVQRGLMRVFNLVIIGHLSREKSWMIKPDLTEAQSHHGSYDMIPAYRNRMIRIGRALDRLRMIVSGGVCIEYKCPLLLMLFKHINLHLVLYTYRGHSRT